MKAERLRRFIDLHASVGMVCGLLLFVAFFAGAINVFHHELHHWQSLPSHTAEPRNPDRFLEQLTTRFPQAAKRLYFQPGADPAAMWLQDGEWQTARASSFSDEGVFRAQPVSELADFINELHYQLAIPGGKGGAQHRHDVDGVGGRFVWRCALQWSGYSLAQAGQGMACSAPSGQSASLLEEPP